MSTHKPELRLRTFHPEQDFSALVQLRTEIEAIDQIGTNTSDSVLRDQFSWPGHVPSQHRWVIEACSEQDRLIGHGWTFEQSPQRSILHSGGGRG